MDINQIIMKIKDNFFLISESRFDQITRDAGYVDSLIYLIACIILSLPIVLVINLLSFNLIGAVLTTGIYAVMFIPIAYVLYLIQFVLLKLVGGKGSLLQSLQVFIYGDTSALILGNLPLIGLIFGLISLANVVVGSARIHKISLLRAILALIVIPIVVLIILMVILMMVLGAAFSQLASSF